MRKLIYSICLSLVLITGTAQVPAPGKTQSESIVITNVTIHVGNGTVIDNGAVGFKDGKITAVLDLSKEQLNAIDYQKTIDGKGQHLYPGFILPNTPLGLVEIDAVRASDDQRETGFINPNARALIAYNTDSKVTPTVRSNGVLLGQITPRGGRISGTSSVVHFDAWNWEDAVVREDDGIHLNWPSIYKRSGWWAEPGPVEKSKKYDEQVEEIDLYFKKAKAYNQSEQTALNLHLKSMGGLFDGTKTLYVHVNGAKEISATVLFAQKHNIKKLVLIGAKEAGLVTDLLKKHNVSVIIERVHGLPSHADSDVDELYKLPALLSKAGVPFCFNYAGDMEAMGARNLPFTAGTAVAYGLPYEKAVEALTLGAARILGIDQNYGSIEVGKSATFFLSTGDALDMRTNALSYAFIDGRSLHLTNHQIQLYEKYSEKYGLKE